MSAPVTSQKRRPGARPEGPTATPPPTTYAMGALVGIGAFLLAAAVLNTVTAAWVWVPWALALVVLAPSSARLDRRVAVNLSLVLGLSPVALWMPQVFGPQTAGVTALGSATALTVVAGFVRPGVILPQARRRDLVILLAGGLAAVIALPLRSPRGPQQALAMLSTGIDNAYHYTMFLEQRLTAAGSPLVAVNADHTGFAFDDYPQWFHKMAAVLSQIAFGAPASAPTELVHYAQIQWFLFIALAVLVTAAFLQALPSPIQAALLTAALAVLFSLFLGVPGALNLLQGHLSFLIAASAPAVMVLLVAGAQRVGVGLFIVLGALVLVTASWLLLIPMAAAALIMPTFALWRQQPLVLRWVAIGGAAIALAAAFALFALGPLTHGGLAALLRDGTVPRVWLPVLLLGLVGGTALVGVITLRRRDLPLGGHLAVTIAAGAQTAVLGAYMLTQTGELTYYFWKLGLGSLLVTVTLATHAVALARATSTTEHPPKPLRPLALAVVLLVAAAGVGSALQNFTSPSILWAGIMPEALADRSTSGEAGDVGLVLRLAASTDPVDAARTRLLATRTQDMNAAHASEWFHALSHSSTRRAVSVDDGVYRLALDRDDTALGVRLARASLLAPDGRVVVTDPDLYRAILDVVSSADGARVTLIG